MTLVFTGIIKGIDRYNKLIIIVSDPNIITEKINDIINPYKYINNELECYISISKCKNHYIEYINENINKLVNIKVSIKKYCFDDKKGTSLILKQLEII